MTCNSAYVCNKCGGKINILMENAKIALTPFLLVFIAMLTLIKQELAV
jgi:hypothetical protein